MKRLVLLLAFGVMVYGCAEDIVVESSGELMGCYEGTYEIVWNKGSSSGSKTEKQNVEWAFSDFKFWMNVPPGDSAITYDLSGEYELENKMYFTNIAVEQGTFKPESVPEGEFDFITLHNEGAPDTLVFKQTTGGEFDQTEKTIKLVRVECPSS